MQYSRYSNQTSSVSSETSGQQSPANRFKSPVPSNYEYLGRLVTRERPILRKSKSVHQNLRFSHNKHQYKHTMGSHHREVYDDVTSASSDDDIDTSDGLSRPVGVIRINDRHLREIYRLPTPPPEVKRVYHRLRSPETKVIERVFVRRPPPQIIENIIEVPPEKVRIINREKYLEKTTPVTRSKLVHLKSRPHHRHEEQEQEKRFSIPSEQHSQPKTYIPSDQYYQSNKYIPSEQYSQQQQTTIPLPAPQPQTTIPLPAPQPQTTIPLTAPQQQTTGTALVFSPQPNMCTHGYLYPTVTQNTMFNPQQSAPISAQPMTQPSPYNYVPQQMTQPSPYNYQPQQTPSHQMVQPTPYNYQPQQTMPNRFYGYTQ